MSGLSGLSGSKRTLSILFIFYFLFFEIKWNKGWLPILPWQSICKSLIHIGPNENHSQVNPDNLKIKPWQPWQFFKKKILGSRFFVQDRKIIKTWALWGPRARGEGGLQKGVSPYSESPLFRIVVCHLIMWNRLIRHCAVQHNNHIGVVVFVRCNITNTPLCGAT